MIQCRCEETPEDPNHGWSCDWVEGCSS
jgi:hypothetical protein